MNGLHELLSTGLAYRLGWTLLHSLWEGVAIAGLFGLALLIIPARRANARYAAGCVSLIALLAICAGTFAIIKAPQRVTPDAVILEPVAVEVVPIAAPADHGPEIALADKPPLARTPEPPLVPAEPWYEQVITALRAALTPALPWLAGAWLAGVLILSLWRCGGLIATYRLRRIATLAVPDVVRETVCELAHRLRISRTVRVLQSAVISTPAVIGHLRPVILLPISAVTGLSQRELEAILAHELAHIRRCDYLVNILQTVVETLLFHHPAVWWMSKRIRTERENCCDDIALAICGDRLTYARALAQIEQLGTSNYGLAAAASGGSLLQRIRRIVDVSGSTGTSWSAWLPGFVTIALVIAVLLGARMRAVGANEPATQPAGPEAQIEVPPGLVAMLVKDAGAKPVPIAKIIDWRIALPDSEYSSSGLDIEDRQPNGAVLIKPPQLSSEVEPGARMWIKIVTDLGQPIRASGRFPVDDQPRLVFTTHQTVWSVAPPKQSISGKVTDETGQPVFGARVELLNPEMLSEPMRVPMGSGQTAFTTSDTAVTHTDKDGSFEFEDLNQGRTDVVAKDADHRPTTLRDVPTGEKPIEIKLLKPRRFPIAGRVQNSQGKPVSGAQVLLATRSLTGSPPPAPQIMTVTTDANGEYRFPGEFDPIAPKTAQTRTLFVSKDGFGVQNYVIDFAGEDAVNITLSPATTISGRVTDESDKPIAEAEVWAWSIRPSSAPFGLAHYNSMEDRAPRANTDAQGRFTIEGLPPDSIAMLSTTAPGFAKRRTQNVDTGLTDVEITLESEAVLRGRVIREDNKQPVADVNLGAQGLHSSIWSETKTDDQGRFELREVKGEDLNLLPLLPEPAPGQAPEWAAAAIEIKNLKPGDTREDLEIVLTKGGIVRGQVTDKNDRPLEGVDIAFYSAARPRSGAACEYTHTDRDGNWAYRFPPGAVYVYIRDSFPGGTWSKSSYDLDVEAGETTEDLDFKLSTAVTPPASQPQSNPAEPRADARSGEAVDNAASGPPITIDYVLVEVEGEPAKMQPDAILDLLKPMNGVENAVEALNKVGTAKILSRPQMVLKPMEAGTLRVGERMPVAQGTESEPEISYEDIGTKTSLRAQWVENQRVRVHMQIEETTLSQMEATGKKDAKFPKPKTTKSEQVVVVNTGEPAWVVLSKRSEGSAKSACTLMRIKALAADNAGQAKQASSEHPGPTTVPPAESDSTSHSRDILPQLIERLSSSDPLEQEGAANQLGSMKDYAVSAVPELVKLLGKSSPKSLRVAAAQALSRMGLAAVDPLIASLTSNADTRTRGEIAVILTRITGKDFGADGDKWEQWWRVERDQLEAVRRSMGLQSNTPDHRQGMYVFDLFRLDKELASPVGLRHDLPADVRITFKKSGGELVGDVRLTMPEWALGKWRLTLRLGRGDEELVLRKGIFENESETGLEASAQLSCGDSEKLAQAAWYSLSLERARTGETLTPNVTKKSANVPGIRGSDAITREYLMEMEHQALREYSATSRPAAGSSASPKRPGTRPEGHSAAPQDDQPDYAWGKPVEGVRLGAAPVQQVQNLNPPVSIRYRLENKSKQTLVFSDAPELAMSGAQAWTGGHINVKPLGPGDELGAVRGVTSKRITVKPGESYSSQIDLTDYFRFPPEGGTYLVSFELRPYPADHPDNQHSFAVSSGDFALSLVNWVATQANDERNGTHRDEPRATPKSFGLPRQARVERNAGDKRDNQ